MYVLDANDLSCVEVFYLGHAPRSISLPPHEWSSYLVLAVNAADYAELYVLRSSKEEGVTPGLSLERTQIIRSTQGHITTPLNRMGRRYLAVSETGDLRLLEMNKVDNPDAPINEVARNKIEISKGDRTYIQAEGNRIWVAGKGIEPLKISAIGEFKTSDFVESEAYFLAPVQKVDDKLIHVRRRPFSAMASIAAVDMQTMKEIWRTDIGAAFASAPRLTNNGVSVVSSQGDVFTIDETAEDVEYTNRGVWAKEVAENLIFDNAAQLSNGYVCTSPIDQLTQDYVFVRPDGTSRAGLLMSPADAPACEIIGYQDSLLVCSKKGQVVLINPEAGSQWLDGNLFQPPKAPGQDTIWRKPAIVSSSQIVVGRQAGNVYILESNGRSLTKIAEADLQTSLDSGFATAGGMVYAFIGAEAGSAQLASWSAENGLTETARMEVSGRAVEGPWIAGDSLLYTDENGDFVSVSTALDGSVNFQIPIGNDRLASDPILENGTITLAFSSGRMLVVSSAGEVQADVNIGQPLQHAPLFVGDKIYVGSADGRLLVVPRSAF